jgi:NAD(P)-dependent dehydrogenase (short-subunit alcohol dehydrogenase family)
MHPWLLRLLLCVFLASGPALAAAPLPLAGRTALITGSTDGLGRELARSLAAEGATVIVHGRNAERGKALVEEINARGQGRARFIAADFSSLQAVRDFADRIAREYPRLDLLVNNAGIALGSKQPRQASADGHELQFAVNYLAGWVLVNRLRPALEAAAPSRIVNIASGSAHPIDFDDVMLERPGASARGYGQSKLAQIMMTRELAPSFAASGIIMVAAHPATRMDTTMVRGLGATPESTVAQGRDHILGLIRAPALRAGAYYRDGRPATPHAQAGDAAARARLAALSARLTAVPAR